MKPLSCQTTSKKTLRDTRQHAKKPLGDVGKTFKSDWGAKKTL
jgi:hypothetical protein